VGSDSAKVIKQLRCFRLNSCFPVEFITVTLLVGVA